MGNYRARTVPEEAVHYDEQDRNLTQVVLNPGIGGGKTAGSDGGHQSQGTHQAVALLALLHRFEPAGHLP
jgi:hypothetical protein